MRDATQRYQTDDNPYSISIHASHAGCDTASCGKWQMKPEFQSTHPMRDATGRPCPCGSPAIVFQSTHPMRDATVVGQLATYAVHISIHASHAGCDCLLLAMTLLTPNFNPRIPCGMRRWSRRGEDHLIDISIHASHAGCDTCRSSVVALHLRFQSTHPMRDATGRAACRA